MFLVNFCGNNAYYEIVVKKSQTHEVEIVHIGPRIIIRRGLVEFQSHNKIVCYEICRFKLIQRYVASSISSEVIS
ncbi:hypothetical protein R3W88_031789 [Solanum pinnatisectum]|uniref:Uncharacterized protein n=1 Tax=Solanum pinnatisectum TaxID=50273 RepID=A0AAV9LNP8_9SOLN|nr:hypothetical protein R3W88_031789 [Solanum pinnatisectum]